MVSSSLGGFTPVIDETGKITGYTTMIGGADTVFPFSSKNYEVIYRKNSLLVGSSDTFTPDFSETVLILCFAISGSNDSRNDVNQMKTFNFSITGTNDITHITSLDAGASYTSPGHCSYGGRIDVYLAKTIKNQSITFNSSHVWWNGRNEARCCWMMLK